MAVSTGILLTYLNVVRKDPGFPDSIESFTQDSRKIKPGGVFIVIAGTSRPGTDFILQAQKQGAIAAIVDDTLTIPEGLKIPVMRVRDAREALSFLGSEEYGRPSHKLLVDAFLGTKGKTTSTYMTKSVFEAAYGEGKAALIGTLGAYGGGIEERTNLTTPESTDLHRLLALFVDKGVMQVSMEYTAHAIALGRGRHIRFVSGVFISFSQDHLDFFNTMDEYLAVKTTFFSEHCAEESFKAIINIDDPVSGKFLEACNGDALTFGRMGKGDVQAVDVSFERGKSQFSLFYKGQKAKVILNATGTFNLSNALAAASVGLRHGLDIEAVAEGLHRFERVPGRLEPIRAGQPFDVLIDYAHSPGSVKEVLHAISGFGYNRVITVMGAGGDRDRTKRPLIGEELMRGSDVVIVTSDNPRTEDPAAIVEEIMGGVRNSGFSREYYSEPDRRKAIEMALHIAAPGDVVMVLGKGAEDYQEINGVKYPFDDRLVCAQILREMHDEMHG